MSDKQNTPKASTDATQTRVYTLTITTTCTASVTVQSSSPIKAGKWFRDVAIPNGLVSFGKVDYDWTTAKAEWDETAAPCEVHRPQALPVQRPRRRG